MSRNLIDKIAPVMEEALSQAMLGDEAMWSATTVMLPTPQGLSPQGVFTLSIPHPVLGQPRIVGMANVPALEFLLDQQTTISLVAQLSESLMAERTKALNPNGEPPSANGLHLP